MHPLSLAFLSESVSGNEVYIYDQMLAQDDKKEFEKAMFKEVQAMFDNKIWENIPRSEMKAYYSNLRVRGADVKREQLMLIWSFNRKRHADGSLNKYKARLCCHGG